MNVKLEDELLDWIAALLLDELDELENDSLLAELVLEDELELEELELEDRLDAVELLELDDELDTLELELELLELL